MFSQRINNAILGVIKSPLSDVAFDSYVYLEESDNIVNLHLRNWNRIKDNTTTGSEVIRMVVSKGIDQDEKLFITSLWETVAKVLGKR